MDRRDFVRLGIAAGAVSSVANAAMASVSTGPANVTLNVQFDIGQASQQLNWHFSDSLGKIAPKSGGVKSGLLAFRPGDTLDLSISAESEAGQLLSTRIVDCALITLPLTNTWDMERPGHYPLPSPFYQADSGSGVISSFMPVTAGAGSSHRQIFSGKKLTFTNHGRYKVTFMMTVAITQANGSTSHRVFYFDPECDVGNGTDG